MIYKLSDIYMQNKWEYVSFNCWKTYYTFYISFICRSIINAHINVTHHAEITLVYMCRLMLNGRDI